MLESERTAPKWTPREIEAWAPPADLSVSEWAEKYRVLGPMSQEPGPLRLRRTPYLVPILNCVLDRNVEEVVFCKSAQIAGTEAMLSIVGYYAHMEPCPIMIILADQDTATHINKTRIQPMFTASKDLAPLLLDGPRTTKEELELRNGTYICMGWASSVARLASRPIRIVVLERWTSPATTWSPRRPIPSLWPDSGRRPSLTSASLCFPRPRRRTGTSGRRSTPVT